MAERSSSLRNLALPVILSALVAAAVAVVLVGTDASATTSTPAPTPTTVGGWGACGQLVDNPDAAEELQALRAEMFEARQAWWDKYAADHTSTEAQDALQQLREEHWNKADAVFEKYGIEAPATHGGYGGHMGRGYGMMMGGGYRGI